MISNLQKNDIFNNTKYFYTSIRFNEANLKHTFERDYKNNEEFKKALYNENTRIFFRYVVTLKGSDFLNAIKNEFTLFNTYNKPNEYETINWLTHTFNFIVNPNQLSGFITKTDVIKFINWHEKKVNKINQIEALKNQPQQVESVKTDEVIKELRNDIFKGNAIELFKYYYECKSMVNNSRVHFRFLFEVMKEDGFIHDTVSLGQYIKFISKDFDYVDTELKSINLNSKPNKNNLKDYNKYKENLKTTLK